MQRRRLMSGGFVFGIVYAIALLLYAPTIRAGWARETVGWVNCIRNVDFRTYVNIPHHLGSNCYQLTQTVTWLIYQLIGISRVGWYLVHVTCFAITALMLFKVARTIFSDAGVRNSSFLALAGTLFFCTSPYATEPVVWKAAWHFLQALLIILLILFLLLSFLHSGKRRIALTAVGLFVLSLFSLELFYLTPLYCLCLAAFYQRVLLWDSRKVRDTYLWICLPMVAALIAHLVLNASGVLSMVRATSGSTGTSALARYAIMPPLYVLRLFWGRFLPEHWQWLYHKALCTYVGAGLFYAAAGAMMTYIVSCIRRFGPLAKAASLFYILLGISMLILLPSWFPERALIVGDRYAYILIPHFSILLASGISCFRARKLLLVVLLGINSGLTLYLNVLWHQSAVLMDSLQTAHPPIDTAKTTILLNNPASLRGAVMYSADVSEEWKTMHNVLYDGNLQHSMPEVAAYNICHKTDGATVNVLNDSTLKVTLGQRGAWTYGYGFDSAAYPQSPYYDMKLLSRESYLLHLHGDPKHYVLWLQRGDKYYVVDMALRNRQQ